jgi:phage shock protein PspC (stress-responsive transcriptional regulator)
MPEPGFKRCPYCAEDIRAEATKCRYCGSRVDGETALTRSWYRSARGRMIAGVCAGLAEQFGVSVTIVRLAFVLGVLIGWGMGLVIYLALWVIMPLDEPIGEGARPTGEREIDRAPPPDVP